MERRFGLPALSWLRGLRSASARRLSLRSGLRMIL